LKELNDYRSFSKNGILLSTATNDFLNLDNPVTSIETLNAWSNYLQIVNKKYLI
jgi:hypothetical protein